jgi:GNAT superfamily N-acetyltransferase
LNNYTIKKAGCEDFWDVYSLYKTLMGTEPMFSEADYRKYIGNGSNHISIVIDSDGKAAALAAWIVWPGALSFPLDICFIQDMVVSHNQRKQGLGSFLLEHIKQWTKENNIHIIHLQTDTADAIEFYTKNGFETRNTGLFCFLDSQKS